MAVLLAVDIPVGAKAATAKRVTPRVLVTSQGTAPPHHLLQLNFPREDRGKRQGQKPLGSNP